MRISKRNPKYEDAFKDRPGLTQVHHFNPDQPIAAPPTQLTPILRKEKRTLKACDTTDSKLSSVRKSKRQENKTSKSTGQQTQTIERNVQSTHGSSS